MSQPRGRAPRFLFIASCFIVGFQATAWAVSAQEAAQKPPSPTVGPTGIGKAKLAEKPIEVLGGRLVLRVPQGAKSEARPFHIMAAPEPQEHETRIVLESGDDKLVIMAEESFAFASADFLKDVQDYVAQWRGKYKLEPLRLQAKGLTAVAVIPLTDPDHTRSDDATFVAGAIFASADRTIQSVDVYITPGAEKDMKACRALADQTLRSVAPGKRKLQLAAGERRLSAYSNDLEISVKAPANMAATKQDGPDFLVHRLIVLGKLGADSGSILVYVGNHPDFQPGPKKGQGTIFGKPIEWRGLGEGEGPGIQALCSLPILGRDGLVAHIIIYAANDTQLQALRKVAETMKLVRTRSPVRK